MLIDFYFATAQDCESEKQCKMNLKLKWPVDVESLVFHEETF